MKVAVVFSILLAHGSAFAPSQTASSLRSSSATTTALNLFGTPKDGEKKGPGMMDQLAMFKKAQEMAQKKQKLDEELKKMDFTGSAEDGKVTGTFKYVPISKYVVGR